MKNININVGCVSIIPPGWSVVENIGSGVITWRESLISPHLDPGLVEGPRKKVVDRGQFDPDGLEGNKLRRRIAKGVQEGVLNPCNLALRDFLLKNQSLIPAWCRGLTVYFPGTVLKDSSGCLVFPSLVPLGNSDQWNAGYRWLDYHFNHKSPTAVYAA